MSDLKERRLKSLEYQIQELENQPNYFKKYWLRILVVGILVTLIAPEYSKRNSKPLIYYFDYNYQLCYIVVAISYLIICIVMFLTFIIQDKKKLKKLKEKRDLIDLFKS